MNALLGSLNVSVRELQACNGKNSRKGSENGMSSGDVEECARFSLQQYHTLLDLYGVSEEVQAVLRRYSGGSCSSSESDDSGATAPPPISVASVRNGTALNSLNLSNNPTVAYINQLSCKLSDLKKTHASEVAGAVVDSSETKSTTNNQEAQAQQLEIEIGDVTDALELALLSLERRQEAHDCAPPTQAEGGGNNDDKTCSKAMELLTDGLLDLFEDSEEDDGEDESEKEEDEEEESNAVLPAHIKVHLLTER